MTSFGPASSSARKPLSALLFTLSPLQYGVTAVIVLTIAYCAIKFLPMIDRDLGLLREVSASDEQGIRLVGDLHYQIQESRRRFLRILLSKGDAAATAEETSSIRADDAEIGMTESRIARIGIVSPQWQSEFHRNWIAYARARDRLLLARAAIVPAAGSGKSEVLSGDSDLGKEDFTQVEVTARNWGQAFQQASNRNIAEVSRTLQAAHTELLWMISIKILVLSLLVWTDLRRALAERRLEQVKRDLSASEERFRRAYDAAVIGMGIFKLDGTVVSANARAADILGCNVSDLIGSKVSQFMAPECVDDHLHRLATVPHTAEGSYRSERRIIRKDGRAVWVRNSVTLLELEGQEPCYFSISEEITQQKEADNRLAFLANYDPITNLPNRHFFEQRLAEATQPTDGKRDCVALLYLELDSFDFLKGTFGRNITDELLRDLGAGISRFQRPGELVGRLDDHIFGVLVKAAPYDESTVARATELREIVHSIGESSKHRIPLSGSIGIAYSNPESGISACASAGNPADITPGADTLLKFARAAMLEARSRGGDSIFVADPSLQERAVERHQIESALLKGLRKNEFRVVFQPQFQVASGKLVRFEALCRWNSEELGVIPPDRFIPIAEQTGLISEIGRRVMQDALSQANKWVESGRRIGVAVNISPIQFMRPDFTQVVTEILALSGFPPELLELEITEGIFIRDLNLAVARIRELQRLGLSVALDDFGTGYSSLSYLQRMPIDAVKLDRSFVSDLTTEPATVSMVRSVLAMAEALHLRVVTEGVETEDQLEILRSLGCDEAQGYLLGRPESAELALRRVLDSPLEPVAALAQHLA